MTQVDSLYGIIIAKDVMVLMRDGVRLATDIYYPARDGERVPGAHATILIRTSYDKSAVRYVETVANYFTPRGYVTVQQDLRGRYNSEGRGQYRHTANPHEGMDGYDTIEWIAAQSWSNGKIGMVGSSHPGLVQTHAALHSPPHLTAIWPDVAPNNSYRHQVRCGGAMQLHMFGALFLHAQDSQAAVEDPALRRRIWAAMAQMRELVYATPFKPGHTPLAGVPELEETLFNYYTRGSYDEFWSAEFNDFTRYYDRHADIPGTYTSGWYDPYVDAATYAFAALSQQKRAPQRLVIGPWTHMGMRTDNTYIGDMDFGAEGRWGFGAYNAAQLRWYDHWLKGDDNGVENDPPVRIFVMGGGSGRKTAQGHLDHGGHWRTEREWPLARMHPTTYYLHGDGSLSTRTPKADASPRRFTCDPTDPVPTICGPVTGFFEEIKFGQAMDPFWEKYFPPWARMRQIVQDGPLHQQAAPGIVGCKPPYLPLSMRPDVLVYQTAPLAEAVELTGSIKVHLWISSSAPDTDFTAKLIDVYPPSADYPEGYDLYLCDSIIRCRFRESFEREKLMTPGEIVEVTIELPPTSNLFVPAHRIRIDIASSNFPRFDLNPNTGEPLGRHTGSQPAHNAVYSDAAHTSVVVLPVVSGQ
ncbi:MAG: CocE/NonD family hydrolase [Chloroflexi bacterium]|nr:CocE/NonD family hydrolase [Chloroflexota bacterium]